MIVVLDNIRSVFNVASIFRTCDALGIEKIMLCGVTPAPFDRFGREVERFTKVSLGAEKAVVWEKKENTLETLSMLRKEGFTLIAVECDEKSVYYYKAAIPKNIGKLVLIMGSETKGLSQDILSQSDILIEIPQKGIKESLNVAIALAIVASHIVNKI